MRTNPFDKAPLGKFLNRLSLSTIPMFVLFWGITCLIYPKFWLARPPNASAIRFDGNGLTQLYLDLRSNYTDPPGICKSGEELRDVESDLCQEYRTLFFQRKVLVVTPWIIIGLYLFLNVLFFEVFYYRAAIPIERGKIKYVGKVVGDSEETFFDWFYFLHPLDVVLPNQKRLKVYLGAERKKPKKKQPVLLYEVQSPLKGKVYIAVLDYPHIAVVKGSRI